MKAKTILYVLLIVFVVCSCVTPSSARIFDKIIAYINDDVITKRKLDMLVQQRAFELQQDSRFSYSESETLKQAEGERGDLLDRLMRQMLLLEAALTLKIQVTDTEIEEQIQRSKTQYQIPSDEEFKKLLNRDGLTLVAFREQVQRNLMTEKLVMGRIIPRLQVRDSDVQNFLKKTGINFQLKLIESVYDISLSLSNRLKLIKKLTSDVVNQALEEIRADKTKFETVAQRITSKQNTTSQAGALIETTPADILSYPDTFLTVLAKLKAGEISEAIETANGIHVSWLKLGQLRKFRFEHFTVPFVFSDEAINVTRERIDGIVKKLDAGEKYADIAKEHSDDAETREKGGDLGTHILTELNPKTREVVESLEIGKYSKPVETKTGFYIYKVDKRITPELTQQEKQQIIGILRQQLFEKEWTAYTDSLMENAYIKIKAEAVPTVATPESEDK